jgi:hypothetical protein
LDGCADLLVRAAALVSLSSLVDRPAPSVELRLLGPDSDAPPYSLAAWFMGEWYGLGP